MPKAPRGDQPIKVTVSTKVTEAELEHMIEEHGSAYAALRAALECTKEDA